MPDVLHIIRSCGGVARTAQLRAAGLSPGAISICVRSGLIERVRIGHYVDPAVHELIKQSLRVGGPPTCVTAALLHGLDSLRPHQLHVSIGHHDSRFRDHDDMSYRRWPRERDNAVLHWERIRRRGLFTPLPAALLQVATCLDFEDAVCVIDSALRLRPAEIDRDQLLKLASAPERKVIEQSHPWSASVTETIFRLRAIFEGWPLRIQVRLPGNRRGDFLIGQRLLVEVDGAEYHSGFEAFVRDRERDALMAAHGYYVLRFTYDQVVNRWTEVASVITLVMRRGDHLWPQGRRPL